MDKPSLFGRRRLVFKNIFLLKIIKDEFEDELQDNENETDEFYLSQFVWMLYEDLSNPYQSKILIKKKVAAWA